MAVGAVGDRVRGEGYSVASSCALAGDRDGGAWQAGAPESSQEVAGAVGMRPARRRVPASDS